MSSRLTLQHGCGPVIGSGPAIRTGFEGWPWFDDVNPNGSR
ncbi:hypothetical protein ACIRON_19605 [Nocardioides sp. NPDC101246]